MRPPLCLTALAALALTVFPAPADAAIITSRSTYGETFAASAARGRAAGVQFHPEKSQDVGLAILRNFIASVPARAEVG